MRKVDGKAAGTALAAAVCVMLGGGIAHAAGAAAPTASQQPPIDFGPMIRPTDDPAKVEAAKQFIMLYHPQTDPANINKALDAYMPRAIAAAQKNDPKLDAKKFEQDRRALYLGNAAKSLVNQAHVVSRHFSLQELKDMAAFFGSPLGRKLTVESPKITQEMRMAHREEMMTAPGDGNAMSPPSKAPAKTSAPKSK